MNKRLSVLKESAESSRSGRWGHFRSFFLCLIVLGGLTFVLPQRPVTPSTSPNSWNAGVSKTFEERLAWLENSPFVLAPGAAQTYFNFGQAIDGTFPTQSQNGANTDEGFSLGFASVKVTFGRFMVGSLLRLGFICIAFWPLWIISALLGYFAFRKFFQSKPSETVLGVCDRHNGPFYSGIHGPLRPNNSVSGTDFSCPGLACPAMSKKNSSLSNKLTLMLKDANAFNETNLSLVRIILNHSEYPSLITDETAWDEEVDDGSSQTEKKSENSFISNQSGLGTLKQSTLVGLTALLEARRKIGVYIDSLEQKGVKREALDKNYGVHLSNLSKLTASSSPLAALLISSLTPARLWAVGKTPIEMLASAYLATEAGKCLVYKPHESDYTKISNFPHLQARAVIHSIPEYHKEYDGDQRLSMRQAIISSRRHGDFGRAFLPVSMSIATRGMRDWLEILYSEHEKRKDAAHLVELDGHLDEIHLNWRANLNIRLRKGEPASLKENENYKFGLAHKSVVLLPVHEALSLALRGLHDVRLKRIVDLLESTSKFQNILSISARLPGFKRQVLEVDDSQVEEHLRSISEELAAESVFSRWRIVRRMLTRYNWLSTRVGDDAVPVSGLVQAVVDSIRDGGAVKVGIEALIPLRQRRFNEIFGRQWESLYFGDSPLTEELKVFVSLEEYRAFKSGKPIVKPKPPVDDVTDLLPEDPNDGEAKIATV